MIPGPYSGVDSLRCLLGWRIGKGEGYADLEYAMMASMGAVSQGTPVVTIVHDCQVLPVANEPLPCSSERVRGTWGGRGRGERQTSPRLHSALCHEWH